MSIKIPSSLKWLANKRARTAHNLELHKQRLDIINAEIVELEPLLQSLQADLDAIDRTISMHEIRLNPEKIPNIRSMPRNSSLAKKNITKHIFSYLKSQGEQWSSTGHIASYVWQAAGFPGEYDPEFRLAIRYRLRDQVRINKIERTKKRATRNDHVQWRVLYAATGS
jgi:hypothetical protein